MSLVYLITGLPKLNLKQTPPITLKAFTDRACDSIQDGAGRRDLDLLLLQEDVDRTTRRAQQSILGLKPLGEEKGPESIPRPLPAWLSEDRPHHVLMRLWRRHLYKHAQSAFLKEWARQSLNLEELIAAQLCRQEEMSKDAFLTQMEGGFDSTWRMAVSHYDDPDLGLSKRLNFHQQVVEALRLEDFVEMEERLESLRWRMIEACMGLDGFSVDAVLAYYLKLRILERRAARNRDKGMIVLENMLQWQKGAKV